MSVFLIFDGYRDVLNSPNTHYSMDKGLNFARGLVNNNYKVFFFTSGSCEEKYNISFINDSILTYDFLININNVVFIREMVIIEILQKINIIAEIIDNRYFNGINDNLKIGVKSDSPIWVSSREYKVFTKNKYKISPTIWARKVFDFICIQSDSFINQAKDVGIPDNKIIKSRMGVPSKLTFNLDFNKLKNPYDYKHSYCVNNKKNLGPSKALLPLYYINNPSELDKFNIPGKKIIIFTGRIKTDRGKILFIMKDIMEELGEDYELHIFPGSFFIPLDNNEIIECSARNGQHLVDLQNKIFPESKNVIIHYPYEHNDMYKYLFFADCGIDFSSARPSYEISIAGHAKLLEYSYLGLPIVCEKNVANINIVDVNNSILLEPNSNKDDYIKAIKKITEYKDYNKRFNTSDITINNENWDLISKEFIKQLEKISL